MSEETGRRTSGRPYTVPIAAVAAGVSIFLLSWILGANPDMVEALFVRGWARAVLPPLSRASGLIPLAVVEVLLILYLLLRAWHVTRSVRKLVLRRMSIGRAARRTAIIAARDLGIALVAFYLLWGFHYARAPVADRIGLPSVERMEAGELIPLAREMVDVANESYLALHGSEDAGAPTTMPQDWTVLNRALDRGWSRIAAGLPEDPLITAGYGPPKRLLLSRLVAHLGITGLYAPFTGEALVVGTTPAVSLGLSLAHEQAHQRGVTGEGEATLFGFAAAMASGHPLLTYSAAVRAQLRLLRALGRRDSEAMERLAAERLPGVQRDLEDLSAFQRQHRGSASRMTSRVNDVYLRANRIPDGIASYDRATELLVRYADYRGGTLRPRSGTLPIATGAGSGREVD